MKKVKVFAGIIIAAICLSLTLALTLTVFASSLRVVDDADILSETEESELRQKLDSLSEALGTDIVVVTVSSIGDKDVKLYADDYYDDNGYGLGESYSGILLLVSLESREYAISTYGDAMDIFGESDLDSLEYAFVGLLSDGEYYEAFDTFANECEHIIKYDKRLSPIWIFISLLVGGAVGGIVVWNMVSKHKNVKMQRSAESYMLRHTFRLDRSRDVFLYSHVTRRLKPQNNSSSGGSSRSSSGRSHGGRSGSF